MHGFNPNYTRVYIKSPTIVIPSPSLCHSEPFALCHSERSEESYPFAQGRLREESYPFAQGKLRAESYPFAQGKLRAESIVVRSG